MKLRDEIQSQLVTAGLFAVVGVALVYVVNKKIDQAKASLNQVANNAQSAASYPVDIVRQASANPGVLGGAVGGGLGSVVGGAYDVVKNPDQVQTQVSNAGVGGQIGGALAGGLGSAVGWLLGLVKSEDSVFENDEKMWAAWQEYNK